MRRIAIVIAVLMLSASARAQSAPTAQESHTAAWTAVGAGAGFAVGLVGGLRAFDGAVNSDRKVWTTAIVSAAAGGVIAYLIARPRNQRMAPVLKTTRLNDAEARALARTWNGAAAARAPVLYR